MLVKYLLLATDGSLSTLCTASATVMSIGSARGDNSWTFLLISNTCNKYRAQLTTAALQTLSLRVTTGVVYTLLWCDRGLLYTRAGSGYFYTKAKMSRHRVILYIVSRWSEALRGFIEMFKLTLQHGIEMLQKAGGQFLIRVAHQFS